MTAIWRMSAGEAYASAFRLSETAVTPKLDVLDLPAEVRQKIHHRNAAAGDARAARDRWS